MAHDVFISYSEKDKTTADAACAFLEEAGVQCWIAPRDVAAGAPWAATLVEAIKASRVMLLVFSSRSNASEHVLREVTAAADAGIPILPLRVERTLPSNELGYYIRRAHWLDAIGPPLDPHLPGLLAAVRRLLERSTAADAPSSARTPAPKPRRGALSAVLGSRRGRMLALGSALVVALGWLAVSWLRRPGTIAIESEPADAEATVDGSPIGSTPLARALPAGSHGVRVRRPGFKDWSKVVEVSPGESKSFTIQLVVADARDVAAVNLLAKQLGLALPSFPLPEAQRSSTDGEPLELIVPRGAVRPADVTTLVLDADPGRVDPSGVIALRRGGQVLWETPFDPPTARFEVPVPPQVRDGLKAGETITWGWWPEAGPPVTLELRVVADDVAPLLADIDRRLATQPDGVRAHLRLQGLLDRGLFTGAFLEARSIAVADPADLRAGAVMEQALSKAGGGALRMVSRLREGLRAAPEADRARVFGPPGAAAMDR